MNDLQVRCIMNMSAAGIDAVFSDIIMTSYTAEEEADALLASAQASIYGF